MPITIGPFTDVPAPDDPVASAWAQEITQFAVDDISVGPAPPASANAELWYDTLDPGTSLPNSARGYVTHKVGNGTDQSSALTTYVTVAGSTATFVADPSRRYKTTIVVNISVSTSAGNVSACISDGNVTAIAGSGKSWAPLVANCIDCLTLVAIESGLSGTVTRGIGLAISGGGNVIAVGTFNRNSLTLVEDIGGV